MMRLYGGLIPLCTSGFYINMWKHANSRKEDPGSDMWDGVNSSSMKALHVCLMNWSRRDIIYPPTTDVHTKCRV